MSPRGVAQSLVERLGLPSADQPAQRILAITAWVAIGICALGVAAALAARLWLLVVADALDAVAAAVCLLRIEDPRRAVRPLLWTLTVCIALGSLATTPADPMVLCYLFVVPLLSANVVPEKSWTWFYRVLAAGLLALVAGALEWTVPSGPRPPMVKEATSFVGALLASMALLRALASTSRLSEARLREAERAKTAFFANLGHEIRTPMNGVMGMTDALLLRRLPDEEREMVETIRGSGSVLLALVDDLLDFSKLEAGRLVLREAPLALGDLAGELRALWQPAATRKGLALEVRLQPGLPGSVLLDGVRLRQILNNLLSNAIKFTPSGGVTVRMERAGEQLRLAVADTGIGIPPDQQARLFARFVQADDARARRDQGAGLGLVLSRELARLMGGSLELASTPGQGSCFTCTLPLVPVAAAPAPGPDARALPAGLQVLVVDDNPVNRLVAQRLLERLGCRVALSADGQGALAALRARSDLDLVLMDVHMPELDGLETTRRARALPGAPVPIIGCSASAEASDLERCLEAGMDGFLAKPLTRERLEDTLARLPRRAPPPRLAAGR